MTGSSSISFKAIAALILAAFLSALLFALWHYRDDIFVSLNDPGLPFQTYIPPPAPDYQSPDAWLALPDMSQDSELTEGKGDIFVIAPTLFTGGQHWVAPVFDPDLRADFDRVIVPNYITPYQITGRVFAPLYRQASLYTFINNREDSGLAKHFAYRDVERAFRAFLAASQPERPITLVGHGQGALHIQRLLEQYFDDESLRLRLAAAYVIDHPLLLEDVTEALPVCISELQTGCIVAFGSFSPNESGQAERFVTRISVFEGDVMSTVNGRDVICVNPLLWTSESDYAPARLHKGGIAAEGLGPEFSPAPSPRQVGAQCEDGVLIHDVPKQKSLRRPKRFGGRLRTVPSNLFSEDIRQNIIVRTQTLIDKDVLPKRAPLLSDEPEIITPTPVTLPKK